MRIDKLLLDRLTEMAKASPRKRQHFDLRDSAEEPCMRMLNALEPETVIPVHRHRETSEEVVVIRGAVEEILYDNQGVETERYRLEQCTVQRLEKTHSTKCAVLFCKKENERSKCDEGKSHQKDDFCVKA